MNNAHPLHLTTQSSDWLKIVPTEHMLPEVEGQDIDTDIGEIRLGVTFFNETDPDVAMSRINQDNKIDPPNLLKVNL